MIPYAMLYAIAAGVPILAAAALEAAFLRRHGRAERGVWVVALVVALALPLAGLRRPEVPLPTPTTPMIASLASELRPVLVLPAPTRAAPDFDVPKLILVLWLLASAGLAVRWSVSWLLLRREGRRWSRQRVDGVPVSVSNGVGPGVFGILRPRIVIPSWVVGLPVQSRAFVLQHEQEHLRSRDHWLGALVHVARILAPWNPIVWFMTSRLDRAVELDCDRRVLRAHSDVAGYGATLLLVSERRSTWLVPAAAFAASDATISRRIIAMTAPTRTVSAVGIGLAIAAGTVLLTGALRVPVPALGASVARLDPVRASAPQVHSEPSMESISLEPPRNAAVQTPDPQSSLQASSRPDVAAQPPSQVARRALPEPQLITDMNRSLYLAPDAVRSEPPRRLGYPIVGDGERILVSRGAEAVQYLQSDRFTVFDFSGLSAQGFVATPITAPFPGGPPREVTETPQILNPAEIIAEIAAAYPPSLRARGLGGTVAVQFLVGEAGEVRKLRVTQIAAYEELTLAAARVAEVYRFSPARAGDEYVALWVSHAIDFRVP
jgi:TonB family protein